MVIKKSNQFNGHAASIYNLCSGIKEEEFFSCGSDRLVLSWNIESKEQKVIAQFPIAVYSLLYEKTRQLLLAGLGDGGISIVDVIQKKELKKLQHHHAPIFDLKYSGVNSCFIAASSDGAISFINSNTLTCDKIIKICVEKIRNIAINENETQMALACGDGSLRLFDIKEQKEVYKINAHATSVNSVVFHPDGKHLLSGGKDAHLCIWNIEKSGDLTLQAKIPAHNYALYSLAFHPNKNYFASGSRDKTVKIWDAKTFEFLFRISKEACEGHINSVNKILWLTHKNSLLSAGDDRAIMQWELRE